MNSESKQNFSRLIEIIQSPNDELTVFAGAGISAAPPTHAPLANEIKWYALNTILSQTKSPKYFVDFFSFGHGELQQSIFTMPLEVILQRVYNVVGEKCLKVFDVVGGRPPNFNHYFLIKCLLKGLIKSIITTNQDCYLEIAYSELRQKGAINGQIDFCISAEENYHIKPTEKQVFKLHGSIDKPQTLRATLNQVGLGLESSKKEALQTILSTSYVYFVGYSGGDIDIRDVLLNSNKIKGIFWNVRTNEELSNIKSLYQQFFQQLHDRGVGVNFITGDLNGLLMSISQLVNAEIEDGLPYKLEPYEAIEALGNVTLHNDDSKALALYEDAAQSAEKQNNLHRAASALFEIVELQRAKGKYLDALQTNDHAMSIVQKMPPSEKVYKLLGDAAYKSSIISVMLSRYDDALAHAKSLIKNYNLLSNPSERWYGIAAAWRNMAQSYRDLGKYGKAIVYDRKAQKVFRKYGYLEPESWAWRSRIKTILLFEPEKAEALFDEVERIHVVTQDRHDRNYGKLTRVELSLALNNLQGVEEILSGLESFSLENSDDYLLMRVQLYKAEVFRRMQRFDSAIKTFVSAGQLAQKINVPKVENHAKLGRLETLRLSKISDIQQSQYQEIRNSYFKIGIVWGVIHSLIGEALFCSGVNNGQLFDKLICDAENIAIKERLNFEKRHIEKIKSQSSAEEFHILSFP